MLTNLICEPFLFFECLSNGASHPVGIAKCVKVSHVYFHLSVGRVGGTSYGANNVQVGLYLIRSVDVTIPQLRKPLRHRRVIPRQPLDGQVFGLVVGQAQVVG